MIPTEQARADVEAWFAEYGHVPVIEWLSAESLIARLTPVYERAQFESWRAQEGSQKLAHSQEIAALREHAERAEAEQDALRRELRYRVEKAQWLQVKAEATAQYFKRAAQEAIEAKQRDEDRITALEIVEGEQRQRADEAEAERDACRNLVARLNGDGGHRQEAVGMQQAAKEAEARVVEMMQTIAMNPAEANGTRLREALVDIRHGRNIPLAYIDDDCLFQWAQDRARVALGETPTDSRWKALAATERKS